MFHSFFGFLILLDLRSIAKSFPASMGTNLSEVQRMFYSALPKSLHPQHLSSVTVGSVGTSVTVELVLPLVFSLSGRTVL